jgi:transposase
MTTQCQYQIRYNKLIEHYRNTDFKGYGEIHHIMPRCLGGNDDKCNLVRLPARAHYLAHLLLTKIYPENKSLKFAFGAMAMMQEKRKLRSKQYEKARIASAEASSKSCDIDGLLFASHSEASQYFKVDRTTIVTWIETGGSSRALGAGPPQEVVIDDITFPSITAAMRHYEASYRTIQKWIREGGKSRTRQGTSCLVRGIEFPSKSAAARYFKVSPPTITKWLNSERLSS